MFDRKAVLATLILATAAAAWPAVSSAAVGIDIDVAPPPPRVEVLPPPRIGYEWAPGYWAWRHGAHVWIRGRWLVARPGYRWAPAHWEQRGPHWHYWRGHWQR
jgi:hypothetical protein